MIQVTTDEFIAICFCIFFVVLAVLMLYVESYKIRHSTETLLKGRVFLCKHCKHQFIAENRYESIVRCPKCNRYCFYKKNKRF